MFIVPVTAILCFGLISTEQIRIFLVEGTGSILAFTTQSCMIGCSPKSDTCYRHGYVSSPRSHLYEVISARGSQTGWSATGSVYLGLIRCVGRLLAPNFLSSHVLTAMAIEMAQRYSLTRLELDHCPICCGT